MITLEDYLKDPCRKLSIPYYKHIRQPNPDPVAIRHQENAHDCFHHDATRYFRLIHRLQDIPDMDHDKVTLHHRLG